MADVLIVADDTAIEGAGWILGKGADVFEHVNAR
jgi:hypothetical protein